MASTEKATQHACLQFLEASNIFHYRNNSGAMVSEYNGKKRFMRFGASGSPDIIAVINGRYIGFEIKDTKGKQSESQIAFQKNLEKAGGAYHIIKSIDDFISIISTYKK
jgi:penicillin-binding protein-related factor A (putative recombinase)